MLLVFLFPGNLCLVSLPTFLLYCVHFLPGRPPREPSYSHRLLHQFFFSFLPCRYGTCFLGVLYDDAGILCGGRGASMRGLTLPSTPTPARNFHTHRHHRCHHHHRAGSSQPGCTCVVSSPPSSEQDLPSTVICPAPSTLLAIITYQYVLTVLSPPASWEDGRAVPASLPYPHNPQ